MVIHGKKVVKECENRGIVHNEMVNIDIYAVSAVIRCEIFQSEDFTLEHFDRFLCICREHLFTFLVGFKIIYGNASYPVRITEILHYIAVLFEENKSQTVIALNFNIKRLGHNVKINLL